MKKYAIIIIVLLLTCQISGALAQAIPPDGAILVPNRTRSTLSIIFTDPAKEPLTLPMHEGPAEIAISPDRTMAVVSHYGHIEAGNSLTLIDLENFTVTGNLSFGQHVRPNGVAFIPNSKKLLITNELRNSVWIINLETEKAEAEIRTNQAKPKLIAVHPSGREAYLTNEASGTLTIIDLEKSAVAGNVQVGIGIEGIAVSPGGREVWVANKLENTISVIETAGHKITDTFTSPVFPVRLAFTPDGKNVIVLNSRSGHLTIVNAWTKLDEKYISPDNFTTVFNTANTPLSGGSSVPDTQEVSGSLQERSAKVSAGELPSPAGITISPNGDYAFIVNRLKKSVSAMYLSGDRKWELVDSFQLVNTPSAVAFLPSEVKIAEYITENRFDLYRNSINPTEMYFADLEKAEEKEFTKDHETPFLFVLEEEELKWYNALSDIFEKKQFIKGHIRSKNENPLNPLNQWFLEYIDRVSYAREHFSRKKKPLIDDRGRFYIKYGPPFRKHVDPGGTKIGEFLADLKTKVVIPGKGSGERNRGAWDAHFRLAKIPDSKYNTFPNESWLYITGKGKGFTVHFAEDPYYKELKSGISEAIMETKPSDIAWYWMDMVRGRYFISSEYAVAIDKIEKWQDKLEKIWFDNLPRGKERVFEYSADITINENNPAGHMQVYSKEIASIERTRKNRAEINVNMRYEKANLIDFLPVIAQFRGAGSDTRIRVTAYADPVGLRVLDEKSERKKLSLELHYLLRDSAMTEIAQNNAASEFENIYGMKSVFLTAENSLQPVEGDLTLQLNNIDTGETGFRKYPITVRDFSGDKLMLSDIMFYTPAEETETSFEAELIKDSEVIQYPLPYINRKLPLLCYFEAYNLLRSGSGSVYNIQMKLMLDDSKQSALRKLGGLFRGGGKEIRSISYQLTDYENDWKELIGFDLSDVGKGRYYLEITISSPENDDITASITKKLEIR